VFNVGRARVVVDYGHNPHALRAIQTAISQMRPRRAIGVVAAPGDRRDADIQELATVAAGTFDWIIVREDDDLRGREPGEIAHLIADTIARARPSLPLTIIPDEAEAVEQALEMAREGDLVVVFVDRVDETIEQVKEAARAVAIEESGSFWVPMPGSSSKAQRSRMEATSYLSAQRDEEAMRAGGSGGTRQAPGGAARNGKANRPARPTNDPARAWNLPKMQDGELEESI
jgi:Mur ligase family, glutamate ligase domain